MPGVEWSDLLPALLRGAQVTLELTLMSAGLGLVLSFAAGLARLSPLPLIRPLATLYVELIRGTSLVVQLYFFFYVLPLFGVFIPSYASGVIALGLNAGAYGSEIVRGAILNVDPGQLEATSALNMSKWLAMRRVILPQAIVMMLPALTNLLVQLLKATSLVSLITLADLTFTARSMLQTVGHISEIYILILFMYFAMAYPLALLLGLLERRLAIRLHLGRA